MHVPPRWIVVTTWVPFPSQSRFRAPTQPGMTTAVGDARPAHMKVSFDNATDALYVRFSDDAVSETAEVRPGVMFDYAADGRIVGLEILDASKTVAAGDMSKLALDVA